MLSVRCIRHLLGFQPREVWAIGCSRCHHTFTDLVVGLVLGLITVTNQAAPRSSLSSTLPRAAYLTSIGNGSTYKMIPSIFNVKARVAIASGEPAQSALMRARRLSGAVIGIAGSIGAMGGLLINLAFRQSFLTTKSGVPACWAFLAFYGACVVVTYAVFLRRAPVVATSGQPQVAYAQV